MSSCVYGLDLAGSTSHRFDLGMEFRMKYGELLESFTELPVFRTTSEERMVQSA